MRAYSERRTMRQRSTLSRIPIVKRAKPLFPDIGGLGPNDILGFRNRKHSECGGCHHHW